MDHVPVRTLSITNFFTKQLVIVVSFLLFFLFLPTTVEAAATLELEPSSGTYNLTTPFQIDIVLDTGGANTTGADVYINYDKSKLSLQSITEGSIYNTYVGKTINNNDGVASLSGLINPGSTPFNGNDTFATLQFQALAEGAASVTFDYTANDPNDSNVAESGNNNDILGLVVNGTFTLSASEASNSTPTPTVTGAPGNLPNSGTRELTALFVSISMGLLAAGYMLIRRF